MRKKRNALLFITIGILLAAGIGLLFSRTDLHHIILNGLYSTLIQSVATVDSQGALYTETYVDWPNVKLFLSIFSVSIIFIVTLISYLFFRHRLKRNNQILAEKIPHFFSHPSTNPTGDLVIDNELLKIKATIDSNELLLKSETQKTKDLITYLAHDLKTPLASIVGYLNLLIDTKGLSEKQMNHFLSIALEKSFRLESLLDDFFDVTRFNLQDIQLYKRELDFVFLLQQLMDEFYPLLKEKNQTIEYSGPEMLKILADSEQLARVLNNLLKNAMIYGAAASKIRIKLFTDEERLTFTISNEGSTIPEEQLESIFEKFYRLDRSHQYKRWQILLYGYVQEMWS